MAEEETTALEAEKKKAKATERHIFREADGGGMWEGPLATNLATSYTAAISAYVNALDGDKTGTYVAVPTSSWHPLPVGVEVQEKLKFG